MRTSSYRTAHADLLDTHHVAARSQRSTSTKSLERDECECAESCVTLCDSMDCSPPGSPVHGILQARTLEGVLIPYSRGSSQPRDCLVCLLHWQVDSLPPHHLGSPVKSFTR